MLVLALIVASILNNSKLKFRGIFRTAIFIPCVTSLVAYSLLFRSMFAEDGFINNVLMGLHIIDDPIPWLMDTFWAKVVIILAITWRWTGYNMIFSCPAFRISMRISTRQQKSTVPAPGTNSGRLQCLC